jgi:hypothetical protein
MREDLDVAEFLAVVPAEQQARLPEQENRAVLEEQVHVLHAPAWQMRAVSAY